MSSFRPMLGAKIDDMSKLRFPLVASYKLDGIRAIWWGAEFMSRTLKTIPNRDLQRRAIELLMLFPCWDGELIAGDPFAKDVYNRTVRTVMTESADAADVHFYVFDNASAQGGFGTRLDSIHHVEPLVIKLLQCKIDDMKSLLDLEDRALDWGYEGLVLRHPDGQYKQGRSTFREHGMLKLKRFHDSEAEVVGFEELLRNENVPTLDERGYTKRSSHQENKVAGGTLGALICSHPNGQFRIGTGFTDSERLHIWWHKEMYFGRLAKYKSFPIGVKDLPRHPVFLGWRNRSDL